MPPARRLHVLPPARVAAAAHHQQPPLPQPPLHPLPQPAWVLPPILSNAAATTPNAPATTPNAPATTPSSSDYPWLLSSSPLRDATPSFWAALKQKGFLSSVTDRTRKHLKFPAYDFPRQFLQEAATTTAAALAALSDPASAGSEDALRPLMVRGLTQLFVPGFHALRAKGLSPSFVIHPGGNHGILPSPLSGLSLAQSLSSFIKSSSSSSTKAPSSAAPTSSASSSAVNTDTHTKSHSHNSDNSSSPPPMRVRLKNIHLTYGPYPPPPDYVAQDWFNFLRLMIPRSDAEFQSHPHQSAIMKTAQDDGVFIRVTVTIDCNLEFILTDTASAMPVLRDRRSRFEVQFVSPHFTPFDEIFVAQGDQSDYRLLWNWRISDIDGLLLNKRLAF